MERNGRLQINFIFVAVDFYIKKYNFFPVQTQKNNLKYKEAENFYRKHE